VKVAPELNRFAGHELDFGLEYLVAHRLAVRGKAFVFVQAGASDGVSKDALYPLVRRYDLAGIAVEPLPDMYESLCAAYEGTRVTPVNAAFHATESEVVIYRIDPESGLGGHGKASLDRDHLFKWRSKFPDLENQIVEVRVPAMDLGALMAAHGISEIDLLQIDTEGYDFEIIKMVDFERSPPAIIRYEHSHLSTADRRACLALLAGHGYRFVSEKHDVMAYRQA
jgi:FkbM family methyltransferase